jgi:hypothetical protein
VVCYINVAHGLRIFRDEVQKKIYGPKREEVTGGWRKVHTKEIHNLYSSPKHHKDNQMNGVRRVVHAAHMGEMRNICRFLVRKF